MPKTLGQNIAIHVVLPKYTILVESIVDILGVDILIFDILSVPFWTKQTNNKQTNKPERVAFILLTIHSNITVRKPLCEVPTFWVAV